MTDYPKVVFNVRSTAFSLGGSIQIEDLTVPSFSLTAFLEENFVFPAVRCEDNVWSMSIGNRVVPSDWDGLALASASARACEEAIRGFYRGAWEYVNVGTEARLTAQFDTPALVLLVALVHSDIDYTERLLQWSLIADAEECFEPASLDWGLVPYKWADLNSLLGSASSDLRGRLSRISN